MPRCIPTGKPASPTLHPFAQMPALLAVATVQEIIEAGATYGRCMTSQAERSSSPDTPMMKGAFALPSTPSPNPLQIGCAPSYSLDGSRAGACLPLATKLSPIACRLLHRGSTFPLVLCVSIGYTRAMSGKDSGFRIRVERELREKFLAACREQDRPAAQVLREFMRSFVADTDQPNERREGGRRKL